MRRHLPAAGGVIVLRSYRLQKHLQRRNTQRQRQRAVAIIGIEPVVPRPHGHACGGLNGLMPGPADLKIDLVLPL